MHRTLSPKEKSPLNKLGVSQKTILKYSSLKQIPLLKSYKKPIKKRLEKRKLQLKALPEKENPKQISGRLEITPKYGFFSLEDSLSRLELLAEKHSSALHDWLTIEKRIIEVSTNRKLPPIQKNIEKDLDINNTANNS